MPTKYETVDTSTVKGIERAEFLQARGWTCYSVGLYLLKYYRRRGG